MSTVQKPLAIVLMITLIIAAVYLFLTPIDGGFEPFFPNGVIAIFPATALLFVAFIGFEGMTTISAEIENPKKTIPKALYLTIIIVASIYLTVVIAIFFSTNAGRISGSYGALIEAVKNNFFISFCVFIGAIFALLTSLSVALLAASRNIYALARDDFLNRIWGSINKRYESPIKALILTAVMAIMILFTGEVEFIASIADISYIFVVAGVGLAVLKFRKNLKYDEQTYKVFGYPYTSYLCIILPIMLVFFLEPASLFLALAWFLIGAIIYLFFSSQKRIFGTIFMIAAFLFSLINIIFGLIVLSVGLVMYLISITDRYSILISLSGLKFVASLGLLGISYLILNNGIVKLTFFQKTPLLYALIWISIVSLITVIFDIIPLREIYYRIIKKVKKEKVAINVEGKSIIDSNTLGTKIVYILNSLIGIIQIISACLIFFVAILIGLELISILQISIGSAILSQVATEYTFITVLILVGFTTLLSGSSLIFLNFEIRRLNI